MEIKSNMRKNEEVIQMCSEIYLFLNNWKMYKKIFVTGLISTEIAGCYTAPLSLVSPPIDFLLKTFRNL